MERKHWRKLQLLAASCYGCSSTMMRQHCCNSTACLCLVMCERHHHMINLSTNAQMHSGLIGYIHDLPTERSAISVDLDKFCYLQCKASCVLSYIESRSPYVMLPSRQCCIISCHEDLRDCTIENKMATKSVQEKYQKLSQRMCIVYCILICWVL